MWVPGKDGDKFLKVCEENEISEEKKARANRNWFKLKQLAEEGFQTNAWNKIEFTLTV